MIDEINEEAAAALGRVLRPAVARVVRFFRRRRPRVVDPVGVTDDDFFCRAEDLLGPPHPDQVPRFKLRRPAYPQTGEPEGEHEHEGECDEDRAGGGVVHAEGLSAQSDVKGNVTR